MILTAPEPSAGLAQTSAQDRDPAGRGVQPHRRDTDECGLPGPVGAQDHPAFARFDGPIDPAQHVDVVEASVDSLQAQDAVVHGCDHTTTGFSEDDLGHQDQNRDGRHDEDDRSDPPGVHVLS